MQRLGQGGGVAALDQHAVLARRDDVAIAGDVRREHRRAGRERLGEHHAEGLAAQRRGAQQVGGGEHRVLLGVARSRPSAVTPAASTSSGPSSSAPDADHRQLGRDLLAQRLEGAQEDRQALALDGLADEGDPQRLARCAAAGRGDAPGRQRDAVRDDPVVAAVEAPAGPGGGLGDRDAPGQVVELAAGPHEVRDHVRRPGLRVAVEGADHRRVGRGHGVPGQRRRDRLVHVHDVEAARAQLPPHLRDAVRGAGEVRDRAVGRPADGAAERDEPLGLGRGCGRTPRCMIAVRRRSSSNGAKTRTSWPARSSSPASASMWRVTPPGYVQEYGERRATRIGGS